jgi:PAS domain S-box-containing protein
LQNQNLACGLLLSSDTSRKTPIFLRESRVCSANGAASAQKIRVLNYQRTKPTERRSGKPFPLARKLVLCFALLCAILIAIGAVFFFSLGFIEDLNSVKRSSIAHEISVLHRVGKNVGLRQVEVFRHMSATNPAEREHHEQAIARMVETNTKHLTEYERAGDSDLEKTLYGQVLEARQAYSERTKHLIALSRTRPSTEVATFALTAQIPAYDQYQLALDALVRFEEAKGVEIAAVTASRIEQARVAGNILIGLAILVALGTGVMVSRMVRGLRQDKTSLQTEVDQHERVEQALRESEARYRLLFEDNPSPMWVYEAESLQILAVNEAAISRYGYSREEFLERTLDDIVQGVGDGGGFSMKPELHRLLGHSIDDQNTHPVSTTSSSYGGEWRHITKDGSIITAAVYSSPTIFDKKKARMALAVDLTERAKAERKAHEADEKYRSIFDNALEGIFQSTPEGVFISANPAFARMLGFASPEELMRERNDITQQSYSEPGKRQEFKRLLEEHGVVSDFEFEVKRKDGSTIWISENARAVRDAAGNTLYYEGSAQDITERKRSAEELHRSVERFRSFTKATSQLVWQTDPTGHVLEDLPSWRAYTGQSPEEILGAGWAECLHPKDRKRTQRRWAECRASKSLYEIEHRIRGADGTYRLFSVRGVPVLDGGGAIREWVGTNTDITERSRAEEVLGESERRFRFLNDLGNATRSLSQPKEIMITVVRLLGIHLGVSRCAYAEVENDGNRLAISGDYTDGCASIVGEYRLADFGEHTHSELTAGRTVVLRDVDAELTAAGGAAAFNAVEIKAMIACPLVKNGQLVAAMAVHHLAPRQWTNSEVTLVREVAERCWSIMERAGAEMVLRESEEHLRLVIAASNDGIWEHDFLTDGITWSDRMYEMLGLDRETSVPSMDFFTGLLHPDDRAPFKRAVREQMAKGGHYQAHSRIRRQDGSYGNFLGRGRVVLDAAGRAIRIIGSLADLTSLLQAEQKLVEQANLLNLAHDAIMVRDMNDRIEFWNHGAEVLYGWTAEEARGRLSSDFLHHEEAIDVLAAQRSILLETGVWAGECRHLTKQGDTIVVRSRWTLVRDQNGQPKSKLVINTDITAQKKMEEQFLRAQRLESIGTLASGVAHDLNNILVPIVMAAPVLRGTMDPAGRERFLDIIESSAHRGADIIKQVLTFARGADGDRILLQPILLLEEVSKIASQTFPKSIAFRTCYEENIRSLEADPTQLHQVLLNLCINARDAMPNGGELCLGAENFDVDEHYASMTPGSTAGPHVVLEVTDSGSGIPEDIIDKIFDPFFTTKSVGEGTGLGLSTVAGIVKSQGGFIHVYSEPGRTSFKIFLPAKETLDSANILLANAVAPGGSGQTILLVDDEPSIREVAAVILTSHGYKVLTAEDGPTALALFARKVGQIAVVVSDLAMPGMDGLMLVRTLRRIEPGLKVIISTGRTDDSHEAEIIALKIDACLTKPYTTRNLLLKLSQVLQSGMQDAA